MPRSIYRRVLIIVENLPSPLDRRVWQEATSLKEAGYIVSIICPKGRGYDKSYELINDIHIYRHKLPTEANGALGYLVEYTFALLWEFILAGKVMYKNGFDVIHACNPPDTIFLVALPYKIIGKKFIFDHHDINPELFKEKFGRTGIFYKILLMLERLTYMAADVAIVTNESYKKIATERNAMEPDKVYIVRSGPDLTKMKIGPGNKLLKQGRKYLAGYVGIMGSQDGIDCLLRVAHFIVKSLGRNDIHFLLVGDGTELASMQKYSQELQIDDYVTFSGYLKGDALLQAMNTFDVGIAPDIHNEYTDKCTMNKVMEYMALGIPVVQFDLTEGRYSAGEASLYAKPGDEMDMANKICQLMNSPQLRKQMGDYGHKRIHDELDWKYEKPKLLAAYEEVFRL